MFHSSATVLHPCHKLAYFKSAGWSSEWIETAKELVTNAYNNSYATCAAVETVANTEVDDDLEHAVDKPMVSKNIFDNLPCLAKPMPKLSHNELDTYLTMAIEDVQDAIAWWLEHCATFPQLSHMAINYLTIPGK